MSSRTPITSEEEAALDNLKRHLDALGDDERLTREDAVAYLTERGIEPADARTHVEQLLLKGYLYEVHDELRTPS